MTQNKLDDVKSNFSSFLPDGLTQEWLESPSADTWLFVFALIGLGATLYSLGIDYRSTKGSQPNHMTAEEIMAYLLRDSIWGINRRWYGLIEAGIDFSTKAANGNIAVWGIRDGETRHTEIPKEFWLSNDIGDGISDRIKTQPKTLGTYGSEQYSELFVDCKQVVKAWPKAARIYKWWKSRK